MEGVTTYYPAVNLYLNMEVGLSVYYRHVVSAIIMAVNESGEVTAWCFHAYIQKHCTDYNIYINILGSGP